MFLIYQATKETQFNQRLCEEINEYWYTRGRTANARICAMTATITSDIKSDWDSSYEDN